MLMSRGMTEQNYAPGRFGKPFIPTVAGTHVRKLQDLRLRKDTWEGQV